MASETIDVYVKIPTGRNAQYYVRPSDTIAVVCKKVAEEEKVKETQVRLKYQGKILNRAHSMNYLGVRPETILKAEILVPRPVTLRVALPKDLGDTEVTVTSLDRVDDVISRVADIIKEDKSLLKLRYGEKEVRGDTLLDAGLVDGSAVDVEIIDKTKKTTTGASDGNNDSTEAKPSMDEEEKEAMLSSFATGGRPVEVVFSFDTTASMYSCLTEVRTKLGECCTRLIQDVPNIRIGIIAHGDYGDQNSRYVIRSVDLTSDVEELISFVNSVSKTNGDDVAECYEWVLRKAQGLDWAEDSAKALVVIGDAYPHPPGMTTEQVYWRDELSVLTGMGIKVYGVHALNIEISKHFYQELAEVSGGHYLTMTDFDLITDMFLAVCYREANDEDLGQFEREVEEAGRMTEEKRQLFSKLQEQTTPGGATAAAAASSEPEASGASASASASAAAAKNRPRPSITQDWWNPALYRGLPQFKYDPQTDRFSRYNERTSSASTPSTPTTPSITSARRKSKKKKCSVM